MIDVARTGLRAEIIGAIQKTLSTCPRVEKAMLYGSRAKGTAKAYSDIDLTLIGMRLTHADLLRLDSALDDLLLPYKIDLSLYESLHSSDIREHIERVGLVLFERREMTS